VYYDIEFSTQHPDMRIYARNMESAARKAAKYLTQPSQRHTQTFSEHSFDIPTVTRAFDVSDHLGYAGTVIVNPETA
jgi:hypothetical protein